jgi:DNA-directed RNA polymerase subunit M/transcription elongation factor TFIIS
MIYEHCRHKSAMSAEAKLQTTQVEQRRDYTKLLTDIIGAFPSQLPADVIVRRLERGIYNEAIAMCERDKRPCVWDLVERRPKFAPKNISLFNKRYNMIAYKLIANIDPKSSINRHADSPTILLPPLLQKILTCTNTDTLDLNLIATWTSEDMNPRASEDLRGFLAIKASQTVTEKVSFMHKCSVCGQNRTTYETKQKSSPDEIPHICITCCNCQFKWSIK